MTAAIINITIPGIGSEKTEIIPVQVKRIPKIQLNIRPTVIFLLVFCSVIIFKN